MIKKLFALLLALALLLCGCTAKAPETQPTETAAPKEKPRSVGICLPDFSWSEQADRLCALLEEAGWKYSPEDIVGTLTDAEGHPVSRHDLVKMVMAYLGSEDFSYSLTPAAPDGTYAATRAYYLNELV